MNGHRVGYIRVSSVDQNTARQTEQLKGERLDRVFTDRVSGKSLDRPELRRMLEHVREGDEIVVHSLDRLGRNLVDLRTLVDSLTGRGVRVTFLKHGLSFTGEDNSTSKLMLNIMAAVAEFEREMIRERQREGIAVAKAQGRYRGGKAKLAPAKARELAARVQDGEPKAKLAREYGISRETLYQYLRQSGSGVKSGLSG
jgi:DNA invertase Pin-like site-specific DNA recombinase